MPDYKQNDIAGQKWNRFSRIVVDNPRLGAPTVTCVEQEVIAMEGSEVVRDIGNLAFPFDPAATFPLLNPETGEPVGQMGAGIQAYVLIYSYVMFEAKKRDGSTAAANAAAIAAEVAANVAAAAAVPKAP